MPPPIDHLCGIFSSERPRAFWFLANAAVTAAYVALAAVVSAFFSAYGLFPAPIWLPAAVAVVAAIAGEMRMFPGIFAGSFIANAVLFSPPLYVTAIISLTNALGPVAGAMVLRVLHPGRAVFTSFAGVGRFLLCTVLLSPAISATGGALALSIGRPFGWETTFATWLSWWLCDGGGTLYLAPALLLWLGLEDGLSPAMPRQSNRQSLLVWLGVTAFSAILFLTPAMRGSAPQPVLPFLLIVPLSWVALRVSLRSAYTLIFLVAVIAVTGTVTGLGVFNDPRVLNPLRWVGMLVVLLAMDVLTIVALVSELHEARDQNRVKSMFLATTSHELRNPLNAIIGFSSMIGDQVMGPIDNPKYADYARTIRTAGEHLLDLINGLIDLSKIEAGQFTLAEQPIHVGDAIGAAVAFSRVQAIRKSIALRTEIAPEIQTLYADPKALRQILLNLIGNAVKFTPIGGSVSVIARCDPGGNLALMVRDTGVGIPPEAIERAFAPFERLQQASGDIEGAGLGLSITQGLVRLHGGTIRLESEPGRGTAAIVTLPGHRLAMAAPPSAFADFAEAAD